MATTVNKTADVLPILSPKFRRPTARPPRRMVKLSHERKVRSLAKKTLGSTRVGSAIRFPDPYVSMIPSIAEKRKEINRCYLELLGAVVGSTLLGK